MVRRFIILFLPLFKLFLDDIQDELSKARQEIESGLYIDGRDRLVEILKKNPKNLDALILLMDYYSLIVADFDEVLKYVQRAKSVLKEVEIIKRITYSSQILWHEYNAWNQKNQYDKALETLKKAEKDGLMPIWYNSSLSWVLFKLGKIDEAIQAAESALYYWGDFLNALNMLGILYGVKGETERAIETLKKAIGYGEAFKQNISAPVNNLGEIYEEIFLENLGIQMYNKVINDDPNCEYLLSYVNLSLLYLDFKDIGSASRVVKSYKNCIRRFPYRKNQAYLSLLNLVDSRIKYLEGDFFESRRLARWILDYEQQLGYVGTDPKDLKLAAIQSLLLANEAIIGSLKYYNHNFNHKVKNLLLALRLKVENWLYRKEFLNIFKSLNYFEDLKIRNSDSFLFYPFLAFEVRYWPRKKASQLIQSFRRKDKRKIAKYYYDLMLFNLGEESIENLKNNLSDMRAYYDESLAIATLISVLQEEKDPEERVKLSSLLYDKAPIVFPAFGLRMPVETNLPKGIVLKFGFHPIISKNLRFTLISEREKGLYKISLYDKKGKSIVVKDFDLNKGLGILSERFFGIKG